jgi:hypothetical protein
VCLFVYISGRSSSGGSFFLSRFWVVFTILRRYSLTLGSSDQVFEDTDGGNTQSPYDVGFFFTEAVAAQVSLLQLMYVKDLGF